MAEFRGAGGAQTTAIVKDISPLSETSQYRAGGYLQSEWTSVLRTLRKYDVPDELRITAYIHYRWVKLHTIHLVRKYGVHRCQVSASIQHKPDLFCWRDTAPVLALLPPLHTTRSQTSVGSDGEDSGFKVTRVCAQPRSRQTSHPSSVGGDRHDQNNTHAPLGGRRRTHLHGI